MHLKKLSMGSLSFGGSLGCTVQYFKPSPRIFLVPKGGCFSVQRLSIVRFSVCFRREILFFGG
jgi:hypothetical protein